MALAASDWSTWDPFRIHPIRWIGMGCAVAEAVRGRAPGHVLDYCYGGAAVYMGGHVLWAGGQAAWRREGIIDAAMKTLIFDGVASFAVPLFISYSVKRLTRRVMQQYCPPKPLLKWAPPCCALLALCVCAWPVDAAVDVLINGRLRSIPVPRISPARLGTSPLGAFGTKGMVFDLHSRGVIKPKLSPTPDCDREPYCPPDSSPECPQLPTCRSPQQEAGDHNQCSPLDNHSSSPRPRWCPRGCNDMSNIVHPDRYDEEITRRLHDQESRSPRLSFRTAATDASSPRPPHRDERLHLRSARPRFGGGGADSPRGWSRRELSPRQVSPNYTPLPPEECGMYDDSDEYQHGFGDPRDPADDEGPDYTAMYGPPEDEVVFEVGRQGRVESRAGAPRRDRSVRADAHRIANMCTGARQSSPIHTRNSFTERRH